jgi:hypothetical protein
MAALRRNRNLLKPIVRRLTLRRVLTLRRYESRVAPPSRTSSTGDFEVGGRGEVRFT